jgi:DNA-binding response OmpR family regulator
MMPVMDGYEVLYLLGKDERTKKIPFIFLTAKSEPLDFRKGMNLGADDYLVKPFQEMDLLNVVETRKRMADSLLMLYNKYQKEEEEKFSIAIQREELASLVDTSPESAIRALSAFKEEDLIHVKGSRITIIDVNGLGNVLQ